MKLQKFHISPLPNNPAGRTIAAEGIEEAIEECLLIWLEWGKNVPLSFYAFSPDTFYAMEVKLTPDAEISHVREGFIKRKRGKLVWKTSKY